MQTLNSPVRGMAPLIREFPLSALLDAISLPPSPNPTIHLIKLHPIANKTECHPQLCLNISIPRLIIKEQHILVSDSTRLLNSREMLGLVGREYLNIIKVFQCTTSFRIGGWVIREGGDDV